MQFASDQKKKERKKKLKLLPKIKLLIKTLNGAQDLSVVMTDFPYYK